MFQFFSFYPTILSLLQLVREVIGLEIIILVLDKFTVSSQKETNPNTRGSVRYGVGLDYLTCFQKFLVFWPSQKAFLLLVSILLRLSCRMCAITGHQLYLSERSHYMGHNCAHFANRLIVYCYLEFKLRYLNYLKLFSIIKELFESILLKKKKATGWVFTLFKNIFLRNRSLSNAR